MADRFRVDESTAWTDLIQSVLRAETESLTRCLGAPGPFLHGLQVQAGDSLLPKTGPCKIAPGPVDPSIRREATWTTLTRALGWTSQGDTRYHRVPPEGGLVQRAAGLHNLPTDQAQREGRFSWGY